MTTRWIGRNFSTVREGPGYLKSNKQKFLWKALFFNIRVALFSPSN